MSEPQEREHPVEPAEGAREPGEPDTQGETGTGTDVREHSQDPAEGREP